MFASIFKPSSNDCLEPDDPLTPSQQLREESRRTRSMVTTRGRARELADTPSVSGDSVIERDEGTPVPKRRGRPPKSLPVENEDEVVDTPRPTRSSNKSSTPASDGEATPKQSPKVIEEVPNSADDTEEPQIIEADEEIIKTSTANGNVETSKTTATVTTPVAKKHKRFDSAEPEPVPEEKPEVIEAEEVGDESSDDDAPEEVTTNQAAKSAKEKEREAAKAIEEYVSSEIFCLNKSLTIILGKKLLSKRSARRRMPILNDNQRSQARSANSMSHPDKTKCYLLLKNRSSKPHRHLLPLQEGILRWTRNQTL